MGQWLVEIRAKANVRWTDRDSHWVLHFRQPWHEEYGSTRFYSMSLTGITASTCSTGPTSHYTSLTEPPLRQWNLSPKSSTNDNPNWKTLPWLVGSRGWRRRRVRNEVREEEWRKKNLVIYCWQQIADEDYWKATLQQMSDDCILTCFLHTQNIQAQIVLMADCEALSCAIGGTHNPWGKKYEVTICAAALLICWTNCAGSDGVIPSHNTQEPVGCQQMSLCSVL